MRMSDWSSDVCSSDLASILTGTYNHVNGVTTLVTLLDNRWPNVAKSLQAGGYATAIFGKWHLGEGPRHRPTGFDDWCVLPDQGAYRSEEHTSELQSLMRISYAVFCLKKKTTDNPAQHNNIITHNHK